MKKKKLQQHKLACKKDSCSNAQHIIETKKIVFFVKRMIVVISDFILFEVIEFLQVKMGEHLSGLYDYHFCLPPCS